MEVEGGFSLEGTPGERGWGATAPGGGRELPPYTRAVSSCRIVVPPSRRGSGEAERGARDNDAGVALGPAQCELACVVGVTAAVGCTRVSGATVRCAGVAVSVGPALAWSRFSRRGGGGGGCGGTTRASVACARIGSCEHGGSASSAVSASAAAAYAVMTVSILPSARTSAQPTRAFSVHATQPTRCTTHGESSASCVSLPSAMGCSARGTHHDGTPSACTMGTWAGA